MGLNIVVMSVILVLIMVVKMMRLLMDRSVNLMLMEVIRMDVVLMIIVVIKLWVGRVVSFISYMRFLVMMGSMGHNWNFVVLIVVSEVVMEIMMVIVLIMVVIVRVVAVTVIMVVVIMVVVVLDNMVSWMVIMGIEMFCFMMLNCMWIIEIVVSMIFVSAVGNIMMSSWSVNRLVDWLMMNWSHWSMNINSGMNDGVCHSMSIWMYRGMGSCMQRGSMWIMSRGMSCNWVSSCVRSCVNWSSVSIVNWCMGCGMHWGVSSVAKVTVNIISIAMVTVVGWIGVVIIIVCFVVMMVLIIVRFVVSNRAVLSVVSFIVMRFFMTVHCMQFMVSHISMVIAVMVVVMMVHGLHFQD